MQVLGFYRESKNRKFDSFKTDDIDNNKISIIEIIIFIYLKIIGLYVLFAYPLPRVQAI